MSDQDFFFDEDETPAEKPASKKPAAETKKSAPAQRQTPSTRAASGGQSVTMTVAALIGVVALLVGMIIGILIPTGTQTSVPTSGVPATAPTEARPLSPDELGGDLPPGHPDIGGMDATETDTPEPDGTE